MHELDTVSRLPCATYIATNWIYASRNLAFKLFRSQISCLPKLLFLPAWVQRGMKQSASLFMKVWTLRLWFSNLQKHKIEMDLQACFMVRQ